LNYLLDTCVLSELIKKEPQASVVKWVSGVKEPSCFISVLTFGEIQRGISKLFESRKKQELQNWLNRDLQQRFEGRILELTVEILIEWGHMLGNLEKEGVKLPVIDSLIAASAVTNDLTVVTRNVRDIERFGAAVFNPWQSS
jgi:hypothetical protein